MEEHRLEWYSNLLRENWNKRIHIVSQIREVNVFLSSLIEIPRETGYFSHATLTVPPGEIPSQWLVEHKAGTKVARGAAKGAKQFPKTIDDDCKKEFINEIWNKWNSIVLDGRHKMFFLGIDRRGKGRIFGAVELPQETWVKYKGNKKGGGRLKYDIWMARLQNWMLQPLEGLLQELEDELVEIEREIQQNIAEVASGIKQRNHLFSGSSSLEDLIFHLGIADCGGGIILSRPESEIEFCRGCFDTAIKDKTNSKQLVSSHIPMLDLPFLDSVSGSKNSICPLQLHDDGKIILSDIIYRINDLRQQFDIKECDILSIDDSITRVKRDIDLPGWIPIKYLDVQLEKRFEIEISE